MTPSAEEIAGRVTRLRHAAIRHADPDDSRARYDDPEADGAYGLIVTSRWTPADVIAGAMRWIFADGA